MVSSALTSGHPEARLVYALIRMSSRARSAIVLGGLLSLAAAASCQDATQITLKVTTTEKCSQVSGTEIFVGPTGAVAQQRFDTGFSAASTRACAPSGASNVIGTLVVTPGPSTGAIIVAAGVSVNGAPAPAAADCQNKDTAKSCIIARRSFAFIDHASLTLPIELDPLCIGKACDPASTCFKGSCVDATVTCTGTSCGIPQENAGGRADGGGSTTDGASGLDDSGGGALEAGALSDAANADAGSAADASSSTDGSARDGETTLYGYDAAITMGRGCVNVETDHHGQCDYLHGYVELCNGGYCCYCNCYAASSPDGTLGCVLKMGMTSTCSGVCVK
jgi:hypothetical protein